MYSSDTLHYTLSYIYRYMLHNILHMLHNILHNAFSSVFSFLPIPRHSSSCSRDNIESLLESL